MRPGKGIREPRGKAADLGGAVGEGPSDEEILGQSKACGYGCGEGAYLGQRNASAKAPRVRSGHDECEKWQVGQGGKR